MEFADWLAQNWFDLLSVIGIVGGLLFTAISLHSEAKTRRVANLLTLTQNHRELWKVFYQNVQLTRILDASADLSSAPVNRGEEIYVNVLVQHLSSVYQAMKSDLTIKAEGLRRDVRNFFALPIPKCVWEKLKPLQDQDFARFVEDCLNSEK
jgi:hypothetical protein